MGLLDREVDKELEATWVGWLLVRVSEEVSMVLEALLDMLLLRKLLKPVVIFLRHRFQNFLISFRFVFYHLFIFLIKYSIVCS